MKTTARLYNCTRCHKQVVLCSHCDHGNRYCPNGCAGQARKASCREANKRYRNSRKGRMNAAIRQANFRARNGPHAAGEAEPENKVTHQGSPEAPSSDSMITGSEESEIEQRSPITAVLLAAKSSSIEEICCHCCGRPVQLYLRRRFMRRRGSQKL